jgi:hypothetical protein
MGSQGAGEGKEIAQSNTEAHFKCKVDHLHGISGPAAPPWKVQSKENGTQD